MTTSIGDGTWGYGKTAVRTRSNLLSQTLFFACGLQQKEYEICSS